MANLLYLVHRLPYPPNKGDKVRSYHLLKHLTAHHNVYLGTFVDDPDDMQHLPVVQGMCAGMLALPLSPTTARIRSLSALMTGEPLSLAYYRRSALAKWVADTRAQHRIDATVVFSSAMAQYAPVGQASASHPVLVDFVDVDSEKWAQYATQRSWPMSWVYAREGRTLLAYERVVASRATRSFFVTEKETDLFCRLAPECKNRVQAIGNGVDAGFFSPDPQRGSPFNAGDIPIVFTGAMDYWPNIDAVTWFAAEVLPALRAQRPNLRFVVVGRSPPPAIQALASDVVTVTGTVPDVRPYLQHAAVVVAPMRLARGVQNKILEAMAMGRPVVAAAECVSAIDAKAGEGLVAAANVAEYVGAIDGLLQDAARATALGERGRACVVRGYSWDAHLAAIDAYLPGFEAPMPECRAEVTA
jgi:polysaccharide biosynthesis protein PslH